MMRPRSERVGASNTRVRASSMKLASIEKIARVVTALSADDGESPP